MAERRMFAKSIIDSDAFLDMPLSAQSLYFHLAMRADDDGFVNSPRKIQRMIGVNDDDVKLLVAKQFIIPFESGIVVIRHWRIHNYIQSDRYHPTQYSDELATLCLDKNVYTECVHDVPNLETEVRLGKVRLGKDSLEGGEVEEPNSSAPSPPLSKSKPVKHKHGEYGHVMLTDDEYSRLVDDYGDKVISEYIKRLDEYLENRKDKHYANHNLTIRNWLSKSDVKKLSEQSATSDKYEFNGW